MEWDVIGPREGGCGLGHPPACSIGTSKTCDVIHIYDVTMQST